VRKLSGLMLTLLLALVLTACGNDGDDDNEPTSAPVQPTQAATATVEPTIASPAATPMVIASPRVASPVAGTPVAVGSPVVVATPVAAASPVASPIASPEADVAVIPVAVNAEATEASTKVLTGTVSLPGTPNQDFVIADDGCVGLGAYSAVRSGQQVVVRDQSGAIIGVSELAASGSAVVCSWEFSVEVPESAYYAVSIPMVTERVFGADEVASSNGQIDLELP